MEGVLCSLPRGYRCYQQQPTFTERLPQVISRWVKGQQMGRARAETRFISRLPLVVGVRGCEREREPRTETQQGGQDTQLRRGFGSPSGPSAQGAAGRRDGQRLSLARGGARGARGPQGALSRRPAAAAAHPAGAPLRSAEPPGSGPARWELADFSAGPRTPPAPGRPCARLPRPLGLPPPARSRVPPASERTAPAPGSLPAVAARRGPAARALGALLAGHREGGGRPGMGGPAARRGAGGLRALLLALVAVGTPAGAYNLDPQRPVRFQGPAGSFFGYAVLEHFHDNTRW